MVSANTLLNQNRFQDAAHNYRKALRIRPDPLVFSRLGQALEELGQINEAIRTHRRALRSAPHSVKAMIHANLGNALKEMRQFEEAAEAYRDAIALDPRPELFSNLGSTLFLQDRVDEAMRQFEEALRRQPGHEAIKWNRAGPRLVLAAALGGTVCTAIALQRNPRQGKIEDFREKLNKPVHDMTALNEDLEGMLALLDLVDESPSFPGTRLYRQTPDGR